VKFVSTKIGFEINLKKYNEKNLKDVIYNNKKIDFRCIKELFSNKNSGATETCFILDF